MKKSVAILPGLSLVLVTSLLAMLLNSTFFSFIETLTIGILLGILYANTIGVHNIFNQGITFSYKTLLKWGIVLLGFKLDFALLLQLGPKILLLVVALITLTLLASYFLGTFRGLSPKLSVLLGVGSSICGASAIVAMGPVIGAKEEDTAISVTVISLLGAIGVILYSILSQALPLTDLQYGVWAGSSLQGVAHALAAAGARGSDSISLDIGTIVKMSRVALLGPAALILSYFFKSDSKTKKIAFPKYVLYFILLGLLYSLNNQYQLIPTAIVVFNTEIDFIDLFKQSSSLFILMAMVGMGFKVNLRSLEKNALNALVTTSIIFLGLSLTSLLFIQWI